MRFLICHLGGEMYVAFNSFEVVGIAEPDVVEITGGLKGIIQSGKFYRAFIFPGVDYDVHFLVLTKNEKAFGIDGVLEYVESEDVVDVNEDVFSKVIETEYGKIPVVNIDSESFLEIDPSKVKKRSIPLKMEEGGFGDHVLLSGDGWKIAVPLRRISGIVSWEDMNAFNYGRIMGFIAHSGNVIEVVSIGKVSRPRWIVVVSGKGIPCERLEMVSGDVEIGREGKFLKVGKYRFEIIEELV